MLTGCLKQGSRICQIDAKFGRQRQFRIIGRHAQAHQQVQIFSLRTVFRSGSFNDLLQLFNRIEAECLHAMRMIGFGHGTLGLHRMHEAQRSIGQNPAHHPHFRNGSDIKMRHARIPQDLDDFGRRIGLHRIQRFSGKFLREEASSPSRRMWAIQDDRLIRRKIANYSRGVRVNVQFKGPPNG